MTITTLPWGAGEQDTVNSVLERAVAIWPDKPFLDIAGDKRTLFALDREATQLAHGLKALGVTKGQTVVSVLDNCVDALTLWLAISKLGAVSVPVNTAYKGEFLRHQVADAGAAVIVAESDYAERIALIADGLPAARTLVVRGKPPAGGVGALTVMGFDQLRSDDVSPLAVDVAPGDLAMLIYTGGTTGPSKGCMVSHNYVCNLARQSNAATGRNSPDVVLWTPLPLFHMNALSIILGQMAIGGGMVLYPRFSVSNFWQDVERSGANCVNLLGSLVPMLLTAPDNDAMKRCFGRVTSVLAAPFPAELQAKWRERFGSKHEIVAGYGLTECAMVVTNQMDRVGSPGASGWRNDDFDVRIVDDAGLEVPDGNSGEVIVRPLRPNVMFAGYWQRPEDTLKVMGNLWFHTGDIGKFDEAGCFFFVDRKKDYLRRRGENISSFEMETAFRAHPAIADVAVHAVPSEVTEDDVKVTAVLRAGADLDPETLCRWALDRLPYFAVPRYIEFRAELPRNPVGRVLKYELRDQGVTPGTWDRETSGIEIKKR